MLRHGHRLELYSGLSLRQIVHRLNSRCCLTDWSLHALWDHRSCNHACDGCDYSSTFLVVLHTLPATEQHISVVQHLGTEPTNYSYTSSDRNPPAKCESCTARQSGCTNNHMCHSVSNCKQHKQRSLTPSAKPASHKSDGSDCGILRRNPILSSHVAVRAAVLVKSELAGLSFAIDSQLDVKLSFVLQMHFIIPFAVSFRSQQRFCEVLHHICCAVIKIAILVKLVSYGSTQCVLLCQVRVPRRSWQPIANWVT